MRLTAFCGGAFGSEHGRPAGELQEKAQALANISVDGGVVLRNNILKVKREKDIKPNPAVYDLSGLVLEGNVLELQ